MIITLSRQAATNANLIAELLAERLGMRVYDREVIEEIARRGETDPTAVEHFDEIPTNPMTSILFEWRSNLNERTYKRLLIDTLHAIEKRGNAIIIGRGANYILQGPEVFSVRIVAPIRIREGMYCEGEGVCSADAERYIIDNDKARHAFVRRYFKEDVDNPVFYDLVVNLANVTLEGAVTIIEQAIRIHQQEHLAPEEVMPRYADILKRHSRPRKQRPGTPVREDDQLS